MWDWSQNLCSKVQKETMSLTEEYLPKMQFLVQQRTWMGWPLATSRICMQPTCSLHHQTDAFIPGPWHWGLSACQRDAYKGLHSLWWAWVYVSHYLGTHTMSLSFIYKMLGIDYLLSIRLLASVPNYLIGSSFHLMVLTVLLSDNVYFLIQIAPTYF